MLDRIYYIGQMRRLRAFAASKYGDVGLMTDDEIKNRVANDGYTLLSDSDETLFLVKEDVLDELVGKGDAIWLER